MTNVLDSSHTCGNLRRARNQRLLAGGVLISIHALALKKSPSAASRRACTMLERSRRIAGRGRKIDHPLNSTDEGSTWRNVQKRIFWFMEPRSGEPERSVPQLGMQLLSDDLTSTRGAHPPLASAVVPCCMAGPGAGAYHLHVSGFGSALVAETALVRHRAFADVAGAAPEFAPVSLSCSRATLIEARPRCLKWSI